MWESRYELDPKRVQQAFEAMETEVSRLRYDYDTRAAKELHTHAVTQAVGYARIVATMGYAALIAAWINFKDEMTGIAPELYQWAGLLWMISVALFVAFELWKLVVTTRTHARGPGSARQETVPERR